MTEFETSAPRAACEVLNATYGELAELSADIGFDTENLRGYIQTMRRFSPELTKQAGGWVGLMRESIPAYGLAAVMRAEGAFTTGNAMMYELVRRLAEKNNFPIPDAQFTPDNLVDSELHDDKPEWLIDLSFRGQQLLRNHPAFFDAALAMFSRSQGGHDCETLKHMLFLAPNPSDAVSFDMVHYLTGAAETILPLERQAQIASLER
jgi:hypothetical protein